MKLVYIGITTVKRMWRNKFIACIQILCFALGMLVPFFFLGQYYAARWNAEGNAKLIDTKNLIQLEPDMEIDTTSVMQVYELSAFLEKFKLEEIHFINRHSTNAIVVNNEVCVGSSVYIVDNSIDKIWKSGWLGDGEGLKKGERDCLIGSLFAKKKCLSVGDTIEMDQQQYQVGGICNIPEYKNSILINVDGCLETELWDVQYYVKMGKMEDNTIAQIEKYIFGRSGRCKISKEEEITEKYYAKLKSGWTFSIIISIVSMLYGLLNLFNILYFFFLKTRKNMFICMTQGATKIHIFLQKYMEIGINTLFSSFLCYFILNVVQDSKIQYMFEIRVDNLLLIFMLIVGQILACIYACLIMCKVNQMSIAQQLKS